MLVLKVSKGLGTGYCNVSNFKGVKLVGQTPCELEEGGAGYLCMVEPGGNGILNYTDMSRASDTAGQNRSVPWVC